MIIFPPKGNTPKMNFEQNLLYVLLWCLFHITFIFGLKNDDLQYPIYHLFFWCFYRRTCITNPFESTIPSAAIQLTALFKSLRKTTRCSGLSFFCNGVFPGRQLLPQRPWGYIPVNQRNNEISTCSIGNTSSKGRCSIAMLVNQSVFKTRTKIWQWPVGAPGYVCCIFGGMIHTTPKFCGDPGRWTNQDDSWNVMNPCFVAVAHINITIMEEFVRVNWLAGCAGFPPCFANKPFMG